MRVALVSYNAKAGDAIGNQVAEKLAFFVERGAEVRVFLESADRLHPRLSNCQLMKAETEGKAWDFLSSADLACFEFGQFYSLLGLLPLLAGHKPRILVDYHGITPAELWSAHNREAVHKGLHYRGLVWNADRVLVHSQCLAEELVEVTGLPRDRIDHIRLPVDLDSFDRQKGQGTLRRDLGLEHAALLLYVGRLAPNKRVAVLVEALAVLKGGGERGHIPAVHLLIVGDTGDLYRAEADRCRQLAHELDVADRLHWLGHIPDDQLQQAYCAADVFVTASRWEGFCVPVIEAMASGLPVVAARAAALPETVGDAGLTFTPDDPADLARQINRVLSGTQRGCHDTNGTDSPANPGGGTHTQIWGTPPSSKSQPIDNKGVVQQRGVSQGACRNWGTPPPGRPPSAEERYVSGAFLEPSPSEDRTPVQVGIVACRYGPDIVGGAEWSLRRIAHSLHRAGHAVEVFSTCNRSEDCWSNELADGTSCDGGIAVHRFRIDPHDRARHLETVRTILQSAGPVAAEIERDYLAHSLHSSRLLEAFRARQEEFEAIIVGPYLFGLSADMARAWPEKVLLVPCFHDEPLVRLDVWREVYEPVAGILYHSALEQELAQVKLGLNHPGAAVIGTWIDADQGPPPEPPPVAGRYLVYCGRYSQQKDLPILLDHARRYHAEHPGRFTFMFLGRGEVAIPRQPWALDLGFVEESRKRALLRGADALVQLSRNESLSLVALEAWAQGTPVIASTSCNVLAGHIARSGAGACIDDYADFAANLDDLWQNPDSWRRRGERGRDYVLENYSSADTFGARLQQALVEMKQPWAERMRQRGLKRAAEFSRPRWQECFAAVVEQVLEAPPLPGVPQVEIHPARERYQAQPGADLLCSVRVRNRGSRPAWAEGPGQTVLCGQVFEGDTRIGRCARTSLPGLLLPGQDQPAVVCVAAPASPGRYRVAFWAQQADDFDLENLSPDSVAVELLVEGSPTGAGQGDGGCCAPLLQGVQAILARAQHLQPLPDNYLDVTEGWFSSWKRWLKKKLLNNFKTAYVDVLSRQQSQVNRELITAVQELAECCATLDHAVRVLSERLATVGQAASLAPKPELTRMGDAAESGHEVPRASENACPTHGLD